MKPSRNFSTACSRNSRSTYRPTFSRAEQNRAKPIICRSLAVQPWDLIPFSSVSGMGRDQLLERLAAIIAPPQEEEFEIAQSEEETEEE